MKASIALCALAALGLSGCATQGDMRVAQAPECKVYPVTTASVAGGKPRNVDGLQQRQAQAWLGTSDFRMRALARDPGFNNVEEILRDCNR